MSILIRSVDRKKPKQKVRFNLEDNDKQSQSNDQSINSHHHKKLTALQIAHRRNVLGTKDMFLFNYGLPLEIDNDSISYTMKLKINDQFDEVQNHPLSLQKASIISLKSKKNKLNNENNKNNKRKFSESSNTNEQNLTHEPPKKRAKKEIIELQISNNINSENTTTEIIESMVDNLQKGNNQQTQNSNNNSIMLYNNNNNSNTMQVNKISIIKNKSKKPKWHRPWKLYKVISGHLGWVESIAVDPSNEWFCTGSSDRTIKIWDLASGSLKLTLTGHISHVRGLAISTKHPYMFSCGEDKQVRCWDLETNKVIRHYHGHLSGVYCLTLHPELNILFTGGRDSTCRVWDIRTKAQILVLSGHRHTVHSLASQSSKPQIITGSHDKTIRSWDLRNGKTITTLTHHKKAIRSLLIHPKQYTFLSGGADNIKVWKCPNSNFLRNYNAKPMGIIETMSINQDNVTVSGLQNGYIKFWDYDTGYKFQEMKLDPQPGSLDSEAGICASTFDITGKRLITCEADKTIKMFKEDKNATPETHPIDFKPNARTRY